MDSRLLDVLICPFCSTGLAFAGAKHEARLYSGTLICQDCTKDYEVEGEVPILKGEVETMEGVLRANMADKITEWVRRNFEREQSRPQESAEIGKLVKEIQALEGIVLDIASGPGGSLCVPVMADGGTDRLLVMSDLSKPVMTEWRRQLREVGWGDRCSNIVFDARKIPFRSHSVTAAVTSIGGFDNIIGYKSAYTEAARTIGQGGVLIEMLTLYQEGGKTQKILKEHGQAAPDWATYAKLLKSLGFMIEKSLLYNQGRGKMNPGDGLPLDNEEWKHIIIYARKEH